MAIVFAIEKWRPYILGKHFVVWTDQRSLRFLLEQWEVEVEYQKWLLKPMPYNFSIQYKLGSSNSAADALSRIPDNATLSLLSAPIIKNFEDLKEMVAADPFLSNIEHAFQQDPASYPGFSLVEGHLHCNGKLAIPIESTYVPMLLREFHNSAIGGHAGICRTYNHLAAKFYWKGMKKMVQRFGKACEVCQRSKHETSAPAGLLQPLPIPDKVWDNITMDFIEGLPKSKGCSTILVVVDRLTKYAHFIPLKHPFTAVTIARIFIQEVIRLHGIPISIISYRDPIFLSLF